MGSQRVGHDWGLFTFIFMVAAGAQSSPWFQTTGMVCLLLMFLDRKVWVKSLKPERLCSSLLPVLLIDIKTDLTFYLSDISALCSWSGHGKYGQQTGMVRGCGGPKEWWYKVIFTERIHVPGTKGCIWDALSWALRYPLETGVMTKTIVFAVLQSGRLRGIRVMYVQDSAVEPEIEPMSV